MSTASEELSDEGLKDILRQSVVNNRKANITGLLLHADYSIIQIIEGPSNSVKTLYNKIQGDIRHRAVTLLYDQPIKERDFANWEMGYTRFDQETRPAGFTDIVERGIGSQELGHLSKAPRSFILSFAKCTRCSPKLYL